MRNLPVRRRRSKLPVKNNRRAGESEEQKSEGLEDQHSADLPEDLPISSSIIQRKMEESKLMSPTTIS